MTQVDKEITNLLALEGYQTSKYIALKIRMSERTVSRHLDELIKQRTIKMVAVQNPVLCGFKAWSKIGIRIEPGYLEKVAQILVKYPEVYFVAYSLGRFDIIIGTHFETINRLTHFMSNELTSIEGINSSETLILASPRKYYSFRWPNPETSSKNTMPAENKNYMLDNLSREIIEIMKSDATIPISTISSKLGVNERIIQKRIKRMLADNIFTIQVVLNPKILENQVWATIGIMVNKRDAQTVIDSILNCTEIYLASVSLGRFNVVTAGHFFNMDLLNEFVTHKLTSIDGIGSIETFIHNKPLKYHNTPLFNFESATGTEKLPISKKLIRKK